MDPATPPTTEDEDITRLLRGTRRVAMLGASPNPERAAHRVGRYLHEHGIEVVPINPRHRGEELFGGRVRGALSELREAVDVVDVFRRSEDVPAHVDEVLAMDPQPRAVWLQLGIRNEEAARRLRAAGIQVVQDRCIKIEHRRRIVDGEPA